MFTQQFKALVVDDDPIARRTVAFALGQEGFNCVYAADGDDALSQFAAEQFDLVVTDLCMPQKNGHSLAVELLARANVPVIVVYTAVDNPRITKDLMTRGVDDIVYKPANYAAFAAKARALVQRRKKANTEADAATARGLLTQGFQALGDAATETTVLPDVQCPVAPIQRAEYERRVAKVQHLFPLSSAAYDVFLLSNCEETTTDELVSTMLQDAALTADVLRLANGAVYNRSDRPTIDVEEAVVRIGFKKVGEVALALNALAALRGCVLPWLDAELGQARSLAASIALERLCEVRNYRTVNDGMTLCAFLHPLGRLVLGSAFQDEYRALIRTCEEQQVSLCDLESQVFPENQTAALSRVLSQWNVPEDIWSPLRHLGERYESIARLEEPVRNRVELIKLAVFIGDIAVGRWMPWDQIEPPPGHMLKRHQISHLALLIEKTRADLGRVADSHKSPHGQIGLGRSAPVQSEHRRVWFRDPSGSHGDWMTLLLASLGIETIAPEIDPGEMSGGMLVNCIHAHPSDVAKAARCKDWMNVQPLFLVAGRAPSELEEYGTTMRFPTSVAALKASCERLAPSTAHPNIKNASELLVAETSESSVLA